MQSAREHNGGSSFSIVVIRRILDVLGDSQDIKKTNLAGKTGLNYPNCIRYIELLKLLGWVRTSDEGMNHVYLTDQGIYFRSILAKMATGNRNIESIIGSGFSDSAAAIAKKATNPAAEIEIQMPNNSDSKTRYNIMIVDDEPDILLTYKVHLTRQGYNVEAFPDAKSALQNIASTGPSYYDLVITDIRMKSLNGLQLYHGVKSLDPNVKVIFVSALDAVEELVSILPGVTNKDIIKKPVKEQEFIEIIKEALKQDKRGKLIPNAVQ